MENNFNQPEGANDFTSKGRTSKPGNMDSEQQDISNIDQQEGELNNGTIAKDQHLFTSDEPRENERS